MSNHEDRKDNKGHGSGSCGRTRASVTQLQVKATADAGGVIESSPCLWVPLAWTILHTHAHARCDVEETRSQVPFY